MRCLQRACLTALLCVGPAFSQCAICYRTAQSLNAAKARALNAGILVLGAPPILLLSGFFLLLRRQR